MLVKDFHLTLDEIGSITPRETQEIYLRPDDALKAPVVRTSDPLAIYHRMAAMLELQNKNHPKLPELRRRIKELECQRQPKTS